jgi:hypothetical protein
MKQEEIKPYGLEEDKITQGLRQQPDIEFLYCVDTIEQQACWVYQHCYYHCVAEHWRVIHGAGVDYHMRAMLEEGLMEEHVYEGAGLAAIFYQRTWELIQYSFNDRIHPELVRYKLDDRIQTPFDFFGWLIVYDARAGFSRCLKSLYTFRAREHAKLYRAAINAVSEGKPLPKGPKGEPEPNPALCLMLTVCKAKAARKNPLLEPTYRAFKQALIDVYDFQARRCWDAPSYQWVGGRYGRGNKDGTYKRLK